MSIEQKRRLVVALDKIIRNETPGTATELSQRLAVSRSTIYRLLEYMKDDLNAPVFFLEKENRYAYKEDGIIIFGFVPQRLLTRELYEYVKT